MQLQMNVVAMVILLAWCQPVTLGFSSVPLPIKASRKITSPVCQPLVEATRLFTFAADVDGDDLIMDESTMSPTLASTESIRGRLRQLTGFSFTALRNTMRAATGISLTAVRISVIATTSSVVRNTMKAVLSIIPPWVRYFIQPFLVAYYVPLIMLRGAVCTTQEEREERAARQESTMDYIRDAVRAAEAAQNGGYWPIKVNDSGSIEAVMPPDPSASIEDIDINAAIRDSIYVASQQGQVADDAKA